MKILITGIAGFIGSHLADQLIEMEYEVYGVDNFNDYYLPALKELNAKNLINKGATIFRVDLKDDLSEVFSRDYNYVFHFAAQPGISSTTSLKEYVDNNIYATENLLSFVSDQKEPVNLFVNIATSSIYGSEATKTEDSVVKPISNYGITKLAAEQLVFKYIREKNLKATSFRLYSVYGPRERPEKLYTKLIKSINENIEFPLFEGSKKHSRSFTYVGDIVDGLIKSIGKDEVCHGEIINLGSDQEYTTAEGIQLVEEILGKPTQFKILPPREGDQLRTLAIINKARTLLGYNPTTSFKEGLQKQVIWYKENKDVFN